MKTILPILAFSIFMNCSLFETKKDNSNQNALLGFLLLSSISSSPSCTTSFGTGVADWVKNSFTSTQVTVSGNNYVFKTTSTPNYKSYYYGSGSSYYESSLYSSTNYGNPNLIKSQNYTFTLNLKNTTSGEPATTLGPIGISTNGVVIYNDVAAPGDSLATEYNTFDTAQGHPTDIGSYHYHVEPPKISNNDSKLVGIALDGYLIFGKKHDSSTSNNPNPSFSLGQSSSTTRCASTSTDLPSTWTELANYRTDTGHTNSNSYHYHVNNNSGVNAIILSGKYIGTAGSISQ